MRRLYDYDDIPLTLYIEIAQTDNLDLLTIKGKFKEQEMRDRWEAIVRRNSESSGVNVSEYEDNLKSYALLLADYQRVKLCLLESSMIVDDETIAFLKSKGYTLDKSSASKYFASIQGGLQKSKNILTKLTTKFNAIQQANEDQGKAAKTSIEEVLANISVSIGFSVDASVTLARFNEYKKIVKKKIEASKRPKRRAA